VTFVFDVSRWPVWSSQMSIQPLPNTLHNFLTCCTLTLLSPYTSTNQWWILNRKTCFSPKHWITLQICSQGQVLNVTARTHQLIPWRVSQWVTLVPSVECYPY
jgi:hypothetical protein